MVPSIRFSQYGTAYMAKPFVSYYYRYKVAQNGLLPGKTLTINFSTSSQLLYDIKSYVMEQARMI